MPDQPTTTREIVLLWWAHHQARTAAQVADHFNGPGRADLPPGASTLKPATLRQWKRRHGLPPTDPAPEQAPAPAAAAPAPAAAPATPSGDAQAESQLPAAVWADVHTVNPWPDNPRDNDRAVEPVADSIMRFGYGRTFVAWRQATDRMLVVGHTARKAVLLNLQRHPDRTPPDAPAPNMIPVRWRNDWTYDEARGYALADNQLGTLAGWLDAELARQLRELDEQGIGHELLGWSGDLDELLAELEQSGSGDGGDGSGGDPPANDALERVIERWRAFSAAVKRASDESGLDLVVRISSGVHVCDAARLQGRVSVWRRPHAEGGAVLLTLPPIRG